MPSTIDPEVGSALQALLALTGGEAPPVAPVGDVAKRRIAVDAFMGYVNSLQREPDDVSACDYHTKSTDGHDLLLRWYTPLRTDDNNAGATPAVLYMHGGGFIAMTIAHYATTISNYVSRTRTPFLAVDFRNAPEHPWPCAVEDGHAALTWLHAHAAELGVDAARIAVMGDSGGGGLAACLTHLARERGGPKLAKQILVYPMLDDRTARPNAQLAPFLTWAYEDNLTGWGALLGERAGGQGIPASAAAARMTDEDAKGLPALYLDVGDLDLFCEEDVVYARRCGEAGVPVELHVYPGCPHAFEALAPSAAVSERAMAERYKAVMSIGSVPSSVL